MTIAAFLSAVLALLLAPGPTNTLMALAGVRGGVGAVVRLLPAELAGYLTTVLPLVLVGAEVVGRWPVAAVLLKVAAAGWVMLLAVRIWGRSGSAADAETVSTQRVYLTTMLNPKALIFGLVLLPTPAAGDFLPKLVTFCLAVAAVALVWGTAGALIPAVRDDRRRLRLVQRIASAWLAVVSLTLIATVIRA